MKSPMVQRLADEEAGGYSELMVLKSAAGYYIGTVYTDPETGFEEPGSRDSDYFPRRDEAETFLEAITKNDDDTALRASP